MDMNRGKILSAGSSAGHVHRLGDLADVEITDPWPGDTLVLDDDGIWRNHRAPLPPEPS